MKIATLFAALYCVALVLIGTYIHPLVAVAILVVFTVAALIVFSRASDQSILVFLGIKETER